MASYSKMMRDMAAVWLSVNPDPASQSLQIPIKERMPESISEKARLRERLERLARHRELFVSRNDAGLARADELRAALDAADEKDRAIIKICDDMQEAINSPPARARLKYQAPDQEPDHRVDIGWWFVAWARHGYNVFDLSADFVAAMLLTDPAEADLSALRLPFRGILITLPDGFAVGVEGRPYTKVHVGETIHDGATWLHAQAFDGVNVLAFSIPLAELTWSAVETLPEVKPRSITVDGEDVPVAGSSPFAPDDTAAFHTLQRIVLGALAYISLVKDAATRVESSRPAKHRRSTGAEIERWEVGRAIKIDPQLVRAARGGAREIALHIKRRFIVRGHYRNQAHGPQLSLRTSRWIAPFWKGPEEGARIEHVYQPKAPEEARGP